MLKNSSCERGTTLNAFQLGQSGGERVVSIIGKK